MVIQARTEFASALNQVCSERGVEPEVVIDSIKQAILAAYRKDYGDPEGIDVDLDPQTGEVKLSRRQKNITPAGFGRIAAQTAKQVILQRIREAEKDAILEEYSSKVGTVVSGMIQRISGPVITVNLGKAEAIMPPSEQTHNEKYFINQRLKFYVVGIKPGPRGEEIIVSRSGENLVKGLFKQEVPEIASGSVEIEEIAREAGSRTKIAVSSNQVGVDPVGSCVGQKGVRVQAVMNELQDEKIDIIAHHKDPVEFIKAALSPAKDLQVKINEKEKSAEVIVADDQLSLAIGREGQNVRLAARLTGYKIDIRGKSGTPKEIEEKEKKAQAEARRVLGVVEDETKVTKGARETKVQAAKPEEKGTSEKKEDQSASESEKPKTQQVDEQESQSVISKSNSSDTPRDRPAESDSTEYEDPDETRLPDPDGDKNT